MGKAIIIGGDFSSKNIGTVQFVGSGVPIVGISISTKPATITNSAQLSSIVSPSNTTQSLVVWESSNTSVATVTQSGLVTVLQTGEVTITCRSFYNAAVSDSFVVSCVKEYIAVSSVTLAAPKTTLSTEEQLTITVTKSPANAETGLTMTYEATGDVTIQSSNDNQVVIKAGTTGGAWSVTGTSSNGKVGSISGTVHNVTLLSIDLTAPKTSLTVNEQLLISVAKTPSDATVGTAITYNLTGPIETVSSNDSGITIKATGEGSWSVTGTSANGKTDSISGTSSHIQVASITLSASKTAIAIDEELIINVVKTPSNATSGLTMSYTPSGPISIVSQNDSQVVIKGTGEGAWSIVGTTSNAVTNSISGTVSPVAITGVTLVASKAAPWDNGDVVTITAQITPANATLTNFILSHSGAGTVTAQTATSITITADEEGTATVSAMDGATQLATQNYAIEFTESDASLVYQLDAANYTTGSTWTPTVGTNHAEVAGGVKTGDMVRFHDTVSGSPADIFLRINLSPDVDNTADWSIYFEGHVPPLLTTGAGEAINYIMALQNGTSYKQAIGITQDSTGMQPNAVLKFKAIGDDGTTATVEPARPFVNKLILVKNSGKFDLYSLNADNTISSKLQWLVGTPTAVTAFLANPELVLVNRRMESWYAVFADNSVKQIQVFNRAFNLADVQAKFGV